MFDSHPTEETFVLVCESSGEISALGAINKKCALKKERTQDIVTPKPTLRSAVRHSFSF